MNCPNCGGKTEVVDSRKFDTVVWRRRRCLKCSHRVHTHETVVAKKTPQLKEQPKELHSRVTPLPVRNPRKQIQDLREYLESKREDTDG